MTRELGYRVEERDITVDELLAWIAEGEGALVGTAAVMAGVGSFIYHGERFHVRDGVVGPNTLRLRQAVVAVQHGRAPDRWGWNRLVE